MNVLTDNIRFENGGAPPICAPVLPAGKRARSAKKFGGPLAGGSSGGVFRRPTPPIRSVRSEIAKGE